MNNGKYNTAQYKQLQEAKVDRLYGAVKEHTKVCECCKETFVWTGRLKTKAFEKARFCTRSCANNRQTWWNDNATGYRTIAFRHWPKECAICKFNKIVAVHHVDENKENCEPRNLIPLCPNHHEMVHSQWHDEVQPDIDRLIDKKFGAPVRDGLCACTTEERDRYP